jgi:hypothetical protein
MAEIEGFSSLFRLDGKVAVITGGESFPVSACQIESIVAVDGGFGVAYS